MKSNVLEKSCTESQVKIADEVKNTVQVSSNGTYFVAKRLFDILLAAVLSVVLFIPLVIVAIIVGLDSPGKAIFVHKRMGQNGKEFPIYKFRTMRDDAPSELAARDFADSAKYITRVGTFLWRTSIDELPQLLNILNGDMSFVGYRPVCLTEVELNALRKEYGVFAVKPLHYRSGPGQRQG